jgi:hypothetical protein
MLFPKNKLRFTTLYQGNTDPEGWLILDLANMDLDGVNKIYIPLPDVQTAKDKGDAAMERLEKAKMLFQSIGDDNE